MTNRKTRAATSLTATIVTLLTVAGCGDEKIDSGSVEDGIQSGLADETGLEPTSVECPDDIDGEEGTELECTAIADDGTEATVEVTVTDDSGTFEWRVPPEQFG